MSTRERDVEGYLTRAIEAMGLECIKFIPDQKNGMPDRLVLLPDERVVWVELKTSSGSLSEIQKLQHVRLRRLGQRVEVVWTKEEADALAQDLRTQLGIEEEGS